MSGGSQHNPNGRQSQLGPGWSPLQLQVANFLARAPQVHLPAERGVTWHTPTPPPHLYHVPAPSPPDPLQAMKSAGSNSVYRHSGTPPELYRHTPTPPDKHLMSRHTPSPGDVKAGAALPPSELYPHLGPGREKLRPEDLLAYGRVGVDLSIGSRASNGSPAPPALSVRDAPTINSLIARAQPRHHARVDALLERLGPAPASPHSVIVHPRAAPTPSPPSSNEDSADSCGAPPGSKRKRKPERTIRVPSAPPPPLHPALAQPEPPRAHPADPAHPAHPGHPGHPAHPAHPALPAQAHALPAPEPSASPPHPPKPVENGDTPHAKANGPEKPASPPPPQPPPARRKTRSGSAETIDDIAAMIAATDRATPPPPPPPPPPASLDSLKSVLASPEPKKAEESSQSPRAAEATATATATATAIATATATPAVTATVAATSAPEAAAAAVAEAVAVAEAESAPHTAAVMEAAAVTDAGAAAPRHLSNVPVDSPYEAKPAETETTAAPTAEPTAASFVEVENQLEKMFAGIEEQPEPSAGDAPPPGKPQTAKAKKRRKSAPTKGDRGAARRASRASTDEGGLRRKAARKKDAAKSRRKEPVRDAYDSGSNASSGRSRGPYIQIRGPRDSPLSVSVINASTGEEDADATAGRRKGGEEFRNGLRARGLHASTLGLRYDATTPDLTWLCVFCERGPHARGLGDLFGPYTVDTDCEEYRALDEATRRRYSGTTTDASATDAESHSVWLHAGCGVWAPGVVAAGARVWGLRGAVWAARAAACTVCGRRAAPLHCAKRGCTRRAHLPCANDAAWTLDEDELRALCPDHAPQREE